MKVSQKRDAVLCGIDEAIAGLRVGTGRWRDEHAAGQLFDRFLEAKFASRGAGRDNRPAAVKATMELEEQLDDQWIGEWSEPAVTALHDGDAVSPWETVPHIDGRYSSFAHPESVYRRVLAPRPPVATTPRRAAEASTAQPDLTL